MSAASLARFASGTFVVEGPRGAAMLAQAAVLLAVATPALAAGPEWQGKTTVREERAAEYSRVVRQVQAEVDASFGRGRVVIMDRAAPRRAEVARVAALSGKPAGEVRTYIGEGAGAFDSDAAVCVVGGDDPAKSAAQVFEVDGFKPRTGDVTYEDAHRWALFGAVAGCSSGPALTAERAAAFSVIATSAKSRSRDLPGLVARYYEIADVVAAPPSGLSRGASVRAAAELAASRKAPRGLKEAARAASRIAPDFSTVQPDGSFGDRLGSSLVAAAYWVPVAEGQVATDRRGWLDAYASASPSFERVATILREFETGSLGVVPSEPPRDDSWEKVMREAAAQGDPTAAAVAGIEPPATALQRVSRPASSVIGRLVAFDRAGATFAHDEGGRSYVVKGGDGRVLASGDVDLDGLRAEGRADGPLHDDHAPSFRP